jgi:hypothetical protein
MSPCQVCGGKGAKHYDLAEIQEDYTPTVGRFTLDEICLGLLLAGAWDHLHLLKVQALANEIEATS